MTYRTTKWFDAVPARDALPGEGKVPPKEADEVLEKFKPSDFRRFFYAIIYEHLTVISFYCIISMQIKKYALIYV